MKTVLEFILPDDYDSHYCAANGEEFRECLRQIDVHIRTEISKCTAEEAMVMDKILTDIRQIVSGRGLVLGE